MGNFMMIKTVSMNDLRKKARIIAQETMKNIIRKTVMVDCLEMPYRCGFVLEEVIKELEKRV
jgi:hypothetical protein